MIRRPPRSTLDRSSAASDVYKRQAMYGYAEGMTRTAELAEFLKRMGYGAAPQGFPGLSLIHISEPTRPY